MRAITKRRLAAVLAGVMLALSLAACGSDADEDCDAEDLRNHEAECGYYNEHSTFVVYPWIVPGVGGHPPHGKKPTPPAGVKQNRPKTAGKPQVNKPAPKAPPARPATRTGRR